MTTIVKRIGLQFLVLVAVAEILFRIFVASEVPMPAVIPDPIWNHGLRPLQSTDEIKILRDGTVLGLQSNSLGLAQSHEIVLPKPADTYRVLVIGDSFVQGLNAENSIPAMIGKALSGSRTLSGKHLEIINGGVQSYSGLLHLARYENQYRHLMLDAVIVMPDLTDVFDDWVRYRHLVVSGDTEPMRVAPSAGLAARARAERFLLIDHVPLLIYRKLALMAAQGYARRVASQDMDQRQRIFAHARSDGGAPSDANRDMVTFATGSYFRLLRSLQADHVHASMVLYPHLPQLTSEKDAYTDGESLQWNRLFADALVSMSSFTEAPVLDLFDAVMEKVRAGAVLYLPDDMHFNIAGLRFIADRIVDWILGDDALGVPIVP